MIKNEEFDFLFKVLVVGETGVGKSCLLLRYAENQFQPQYISTIGVDFKLKKVQHKDKVIKLQIWDTAGQERFRTITASFYKGANAVLLVYDVCNRNSFLKISYWVQQIRKHAPVHVCILLVGNKIDMERDRLVTAKEAMELAKEHGLAFFETSAALGTNVEAVFERAVAEIYQSYLDGKMETIKSTKLLDDDQAQHSWCQC